jgi:carbon monoxide dehydrogenase subunit G
MASLIRTILLDADVATVWAALRDFPAVHTRLAPGFVVATAMDGDTRVVTFFNGATARERLVSCDDAARRLVYAITGGRLTHHNASAQVFEDGPGRCRFVWIADLLPDAAAPMFDEMMARGAEVMKATLEAGGP